MPSYIPEHVWGLLPGTYGQFGLVPWPKHLTPRQTPTNAPGRAKWRLGRSTDGTPSLRPVAQISGQDMPSYADGVLFLAIDAYDRLSIATTIERLINFLDLMDGDCDLEANGDEQDASFREGWGHPGMHPNEDDEDGGDDEPSHGALNEGSQASWGLSGDRDLEPDLGWTEEVDQERRTVLTEGWFVQDGEIDALDEGEPMGAFIASGQGA